MLLNAQNTYLNQLKSQKSARSFGNKDWDFDLELPKHKPNWNKTKKTKNSKNVDVLGVVVMDDNMDEYIEFVFVYTDKKKPDMFIKRYTTKNHFLTFYTDKGEFYEYGRYDPKTKLYRQVLTKEKLSKKARMMNDAGGEDVYIGLPEVTVYGQRPYNYDNGNWNATQIPVTPTAFDNGAFFPAWVAENIALAAQEAQLNNLLSTNTQLRDYYLGLNKQEQAFFKKHWDLLPGAFAAKTEAELQILVYFINGNSNDGNNANAFKHALWSALNTSIMGPQLAEELGIAHESEGPFNTNQTMDLFNNSFGINTCLNRPNGSDGIWLTNQILQSVANGELLRRSTGDVNSPLIPTDGTGRRGN